MYSYFKIQLNTKYPKIENMIIFYFYVSTTHHPTHSNSKILGGGISEQWCAEATTSGWRCLLVNTTLYRHFLFMIFPPVSACLTKYLSFRLVGIDCGLLRKNTLIWSKCTDNDANSLNKVTLPLLALPESNIFYCTRE